MTAKPKILLVDDCEENLVVLEGLLSRQDVELLPARSGEQALELLLVHEVALALVDVQMPGMDGFELAELMRGAARTRGIPIIFVTAGIHDQARVFKGYDAGAVDFLFKPLDAHVLSGKVAVFMQLHRQKQQLAERVRELEVALAERREMEAALKIADRRKDEFLAMLAHELRNPLAPIRNAVQILKRAGTDAARIAWCRDIIDHQVEHLVRLVDDLLDVSRISRGRIELKKEPLAVRDVVQQAVETSRPLLDARRQEFSVALPAEPLWVEGDRVRLAQVVANLLNNAAKYTREGGRIGLTVESSGDHVCIRVSDTGCGIEPAALANLFDLFYQVDRSLDRSQGGLGIGLSIVHRLVAMHGGDVRAFSTGRDHGAEFVVRLPRLASPECAAAAAAALPAPPPGKLRLLIVDDNRDAAESLAVLLELDGHAVRVAHDGPSALAMARAERPEVVVLDIGLPGMDGYAVAQTLRLDSEGRRPLLIALTGYGQPDDRAKALAAGFDEHLVKPVDFEVLQKLLARCRTTDSGIAS